MYYEIRESKTQNKYTNKKIKATIQWATLGDSKIHFLYVSYAFWNESFRLFSLAITTRSILKKNKRLNDLFVRNKAFQRAAFEAQKQHFRKHRNETRIWKFHSAYKKKSNKPRICCLPPQPWARFIPKTIVKIRNCLRYEYSIKRKGICVSKILV